MKFENYKKKAEKFFDKVSPDLLIERFRKLGYEFVPVEENMTLTPNSEGIFSLNETVKVQLFSHNVDTYEEKADNALLEYTHAA